jgi:putative endonuclease
MDGGGLIWQREASAVAPASDTPCGTVAAWNHGADGGWVVYLMRCRDRSLYCGITNDLPKRLKAHAAGKASRYTRTRLPVKVVYVEPQAGRSPALKREAAIKRLRRSEKDRLIAGSRRAVLVATSHGRRGPRAVTAKPASVP